MLTRNLPQASPAPAWGSDADCRALLEAAPDALVVMNADGEILLANVRAEQEFGYQRHELIGRQVSRIVPEELSARLAPDTGSIAPDPPAGNESPVEISGRRKDGSDFPIELALSRLQTGKGVLAIAAIRNIAGRRTVEAECMDKVKKLSRSNEELAQFANVASHDLQEPLRMVASYLDLLAKRYKGKLDGDADEFISFAVDGAKRMQRLIQELLAYSRAGATEPTFQEISGEEALRCALINLRASIQTSRAMVTHGPLPTVTADEGQLIQLFQNLIGNGIKYQRAEVVPRVHVSATQMDDGTHAFLVKDNGIGIDPRNSEKIFGMFQRLHTREEFEGTGIGLAICKKIVERHGGRISVESQPGEGSTFRFTLGGRGRTT